MRDLTSAQFDLVWNLFSFVIGAMGATALLFVLLKDEVAPRYRLFMAVRAILVALAAYNYYRLLESWNGSFRLTGTAMSTTGQTFNDSLRYSDWIVTVPLLLISLILVLDLSPRSAMWKSFVLGSQAVQMIALGYPGQISTDPATRWLWFSLSMVPFSIIIYQLYFAMAKALQDQPEPVRGLIKTARTVMVLSWCLYPVIYLVPLFGITGTTAYIGTQVGYAVADLIAKPVLGILLLVVVLRKSKLNLIAEAAPMGTAVQMERA